MRLMYLHEQILSQALGTADWIRALHAGLIHLVHFTVKPFLLFTYISNYYLRSEILLIRVSNHYHKFKSSQIKAWKHIQRKTWEKNLSKAVKTAIKVYFIVSTVILCVCRAYGVQNIDILSIFCEKRLMTKLFTFFYSVLLLNRLSQKL